MPDTVAQIPARWVAPIRVFLIFAIVLHMVLFAAGLEPRYAELTAVCEPTLCEPLEPTQADVDGLAELGLSLDFYAYFHIGIEVVYLAAVLLLVGVLLWRASMHWIGVLALLAMLYYGTFVGNVVYALGETGPQWNIPVTVGYLLSGIAPLTLFYIFPDGRFYPRWTMIPPLILIPAYLITSTVTGLNGLFIGAAGASLTLFTLVGGLSLVLSILLQLVTQIVRYRRYYSPLQRQQTRWLIIGIVAQIMGLVIWGTVFESGWVAPGATRILISFVATAIAFWVGFGTIPVVIVIAIMRYRLWNIDLIIRRTLIYAGVTAVLAITYFGGVILLQTLFNQITGSDSPLAVVASTLLIAALFNPLRRRMQAFVDRRFYRQKYDTQVTLERFSDIARDEVVLEAIEQALVSTIHDTMQPEHISLWLTSSE